MTNKKSEKIGYDLGNTILKTIGGEKHPHNGALRVIKRLTQERFGDNSYIVSRVDPEQKLRAEAWLIRDGFHELTGVPRTHVKFCPERIDKAEICSTLGITHMIDDRPEVLAHMPFVEHRILFQGDPVDYEQFKDQLEGVHRVESWEEIEQLLL